MNRTDARKIADTITNEQLKEMLDNAKASITDWTRVSTCNKSFTKGVAWNILAKDFDVKYQHHRITRVNLIREFGEYLPKELKPQKQIKPKQQPPMHREPQF